MEYKGKLYGKVGQTYWPLLMTTQDVELLEEKVKTLESMKDEAQFEQLAQLIDSLENMSCALELEFPDSYHLRAIRKLLPEKIEDFKKAFCKLSGLNPWE